MKNFGNKKVHAYKDFTLPKGQLLRLGEEVVKAAEKIGGEVARDIAEGGRFRDRIEEKVHDAVDGVLSSFGVLDVNNVNEWETPLFNDAFNIILYKIHEAIGAEAEAGRKALEGNTEAKREFRSVAGSARRVRADAEVKGKDYYLGKFREAEEECRRISVEDIGTDENWDGIFGDTASTDEVVGYYISFYGDEALSMWTSNTEHLSNPTEQDKAVDRILKSLYGKATASARRIGAGTHRTHAATLNPSFSTGSRKFKYGRGVTECKSRAEIVNFCKMKAGEGAKVVQVTDAEGFRKLRQLKDVVCGWGNLGYALDRNGNSVAHVWVDSYTDTYYYCTDPSLLVEFT